MRRAQSGEKQETAQAAVLRRGGRGLRALDRARLPRRVGLGRPDRHRRLAALPPLRGVDAGAADARLGRLHPARRLRPARAAGARCRRGRARGPDRAAVARGGAAERRPGAGLAGGHTRARPLHRRVVAGPPVRAGGGEGLARRHRPQRPRRLVPVPRRGGGLPLAAAPPHLHGVVPAAPRRGADSPGASRPWWTGRWGTRRPTRRQAGGCGPRHGEWDAPGRGRRRGADRARLRRGRGAARRPVRRVDGRLRHAAARRLGRVQRGGADAARRGRRPLWRPACSAGGRS